MLAISRRAVPTVVLAALPLPGLKGTPSEPLPVDLEPGLGTAIDDGRLAPPRLGAVALYLDIKF